FHMSANTRILHPFPTRRSSDLAIHRRSNRPNSFWKTFSSRHPGLPRNYSSSRHAIPDINSQPATPPNQPPRRVGLTRLGWLTSAELASVFFCHVERSRGHL